MRERARVCEGYVSQLFLGVVLGVGTSLAIIWLRKRDLVSLFYLCCNCVFSVALPHHVVAWSPYYLVILTYY